VPASSHARTTRRPTATRPPWRMCAVERLRQRAAKQRLVAQALNAHAASRELRANAIAKRAVDLPSGRSKPRDWAH